MAVDKDLTLTDLDLVAADRRQTFNKGPLRILRVAKDHDIATLRLVKPVDKLVAYCFEYGQTGELDTLYNNDGTVMEALQDIIEAEAFFPE